MVGTRPTPGWVMESNVSPSSLLRGLGISNLTETGDGRTIIKSREGEGNEDFYLRRAFRTLLRGSNGLVSRGPPRPSP